MSDTKIIGKIKAEITYTDEGVCCDLSAPGGHHGSLALCCDLGTVGDADGAPTISESVLAEFTDWAEKKGW